MSPSDVMALLMVDQVWAFNAQGEKTYSEQALFWGIFLLSPEQTSFWPDVACAPVSEKSWLATNRL